MAVEDKIMVPPPLPSRHPDKSAAGKLRQSRVVPEDGHKYKENEQVDNQRKNIDNPNSQNQGKYGAF